MKKKKLSILLIPILLLSSCHSTKDLNRGKYDIIKETINDEFYFEFSKYNEDVTIHTSLQSEMLNNYEYVTKYATGNKELSHPQGINFIARAMVDKVEHNSGLVLTLKEENTDKEFNYVFAGGGVRVYNLKIDTKYTYYISHYQYQTTSYELYVSDKEIRNLMCDGVTNFRDIGGYTNLDGKKIKQDMLFRCGNPDRDNFNLIASFKNEFHIKSEIDLRIEEEPQQPIYEGCNYYYCPMDYEANMIETYKDKIKEVFSLLAKEENYPMSFHCAIGTDRTGLIAYLINGVLNASKEYMLKDYLFSNFGNIGSKRTINNIYDKYVKYFDTRSNKSLHENICDYLLSIGVTQQELDSIVSILTE